MLATPDTVNLSDRLGLIDSLLVQYGLPLTKATLNFAWYATSPTGQSLRRELEGYAAEGHDITEEWVAQALSVYLALIGVETNGISGEIAARAETVTKTLEGVLARQEADVSEFAGELRQGREGLNGADPADAVSRLGTSVTTALGRIAETEAELADARHQITKMKGELENARQEARQDHLTRLANRRAFKAKFEETIRAGQNSCLAILDLDRFKAVNDRHGHLVGDRVLKTVANHLTKTLPHAFVSRYGGEEFALLFNNAHLADARAALENARATLYARRLRLKDTDTYLDPLNFSAGVVQLEQNESYERAMSRTDELLYKAKESGRGRTVTMQDAERIRGKFAA
ncbi:GGDEF domain-containing protein [Pacificimonas sp. ICDLI1SI03]